jgi:hypothetical protein
VKAKEAKQQALVEREPRVDPPFEIPDADPRFAFAGHKSMDVEREALVDLTYCYAQERPPEKAVEYLEAHASTREAYVAALHKMALRFATLEQPKGAADVTRELLRLGSDDDERLDDARLLHSVVTRMNDYSQVGEDVDLILKAMRRRLLRPDLDEAGQKQLVREFEMISRDLATRSQKVLADNLAETSAPAAEPVAPKTGKPEKNRSLASKGKEWNQIPATPQESARAYEAYLRAIPESPYRLEMVTNLADVLIDAGDFLEAGNRYREAAAILGKKGADGQSAAVKEDEAKLQSPDDPPDEKKSSSDPDADQSTDKPTKAADKKADEGEAPELSKLSKSERAQRRADALYDAVVAYQKSLGSKQSDSHEVRATARAGLRQAGAQYLAEGNPDKGRELRIKFAIAETYYKRRQVHAGGRPADCRGARVPEHGAGRRLRAARARFVQHAQRHQRSHRRGPALRERTAAQRVGEGVGAADPRGRGQRVASTICRSPPPAIRRAAWNRSWPSPMSTRAPTSARRRSSTRSSRRAPRATRRRSTRSAIRS